MSVRRRSIAFLAVVAAALAIVSGSTNSDPRTPPAAPGQPDPFLGTAVIGSGGLTAAVDAYGSVVDLRFPGPAGEAQIRNYSKRQAAGTVPSDTGVVVAAGPSGEERPLWYADRLTQRYKRGTNVLLTGADLDGVRLRIADAIAPLEPLLARRFIVRSAGRGAIGLRLGINLDLGGDVTDDELSTEAGGLEQSDDEVAARCAVSPPPASIESGDDDRDAKAVLRWSGRRLLRVEITCSFEDEGGQPAFPRGLAGRVIASSAEADRSWLSGAAPLLHAPAWARAMYARSLLVLRALTDSGSGAMAAGLRDRWAYVWPRDAAAGAIALARAGYLPAAQRVTRFLLELDLSEGARFLGDSEPVDDSRELPGDAIGWIEAAARASGISDRAASAESDWRDRGDYGERDDDRGDFLANAIAAGAPAEEIADEFGTEAGLERVAGDDESGLDSSAAWAARPFARPALADVVRETLRALLAAGDRFGITPAEDWPDPDPWTAPTAWSAWGLAGIGDRRGALEFLAALRRAATPAGLLPERVDRDSGIPRSTTPLAWSHAFAILALRELYR